jgi:hypothetical protein
MLTQCERDNAFRQLFRWRLDQMCSSRHATPKLLLDALTVEGMRGVPGTDAWYFPQKTKLCRALIMFRKLRTDVRLRKIKQLWGSLEEQQLQK